MTFSFGPRLLEPPKSRAEREHALAVLAAALQAVDPRRAVLLHVLRDGDRLEAGGRTYDLVRYRRVLVVGAGKAGAPMAAAVEDLFGDRIADGLVNVKYGHLGPTKVVRLREAGHPIPDESGLAGSREIADLLAAASADDLVICLISGGGSALLSLPTEGVGLAELQQLTELLLKRGATIDELNAVRKHLDRAKGGGLARLAAPAEVLTLVLSDVVGDRIDVIASGPTVSDLTTFSDACQVIERYAHWDELAPGVAARLRDGAAGRTPDTPGPDDPIFAQTHTLIIGSNAQAAGRAEAEAAARGFRTLNLGSYVQGEAREVGRVLAGLAHSIHASGLPLPRPACVIAGGETTVTVRGEGVGGRNQEVALAAALGLTGLPSVLVAALGTDGTDGPTDAAGAVADGTTIARGQALGLDPHRALADNDTYHYFEALGDLLLTGPTNTNVNDLLLVFAFEMSGES